MRRSKDRRDRHPCSCDRLFETRYSKSSVWLCCGIPDFLCCRGRTQKNRKMSTTDAVAIFAEGTFEDQVRGYFYGPCVSLNVIPDRRAFRLHRTEPTGAGTRTVCPVHSKETHRRGEPDASIRGHWTAERGVFRRPRRRQGTRRGH